MIHTSSTTTPGAPGVTDCSQSTPGPWLADCKQYGERGITVATVTGRVIAEVPDAANARLIRAAPYLFEACTEMLELLKNSDVQFHICNGGRGNMGESSWYNRTVNKALVAIRNTRG